MIPLFNCPTLAPWCKEPTQRKRPWCWERFEGRRRREWQDEMVGGITDSIDMTLSKLREIVKDREAYHAAVHGVAKNWTWLGDWRTNYLILLLWWLNLYLEISKINNATCVFLCQASPRVTVDDYLVAKLADTLNHEDPTPEIFDDIQRKVLCTFIIISFLKTMYMSICL